MAMMLFSIVSPDHATKTESRPSCSPSRKAHQAQRVGLDSSLLRRTAWSRTATVLCGLALGTGCGPLEVLLDVRGLQEDAAVLKIEARLDGHPLSVAQLCKPGVESLSAVGCTAVASDRRSLVLVVPEVYGELSVGLTASDEEGCVLQQGSAAPQMLTRLPRPKRMEITLQERSPLPGCSAGSWCKLPTPEDSSQTTFWNLWDRTGRGAWVATEHGLLRHRCDHLEEAPVASDQGFSALSVHGLGSNRLTASLRSDTEAKVRDYRTIDRQPTAQPEGDVDIANLPKNARIFGVADTLYYAGVSTAADVSVVERVAGVTYKSHALAAGFKAYGIWGSSRTDVWVVGDAFGVYHYDGSIWSDRKPKGIGTAGEFYDVTGSSSDDLWIVGRRLDMPLAVVYHWVMGQWQAMDLRTAGNPENLSAAWAADARHAWFTGTSCTVLEYDADANVLRPASAQPSCPERIDFKKIWSLDGRLLWLLGNTADSGGKERAGRLFFLHRSP